MHHLVVVRGVCKISAIETQHVTENSLHICGLEQIRHNKVQVTQPKTSDYTSAGEISHSGSHKIWPDIRVGPTSGQFLTQLKREQQLQIPASVYTAVTV